MPGRWFRHRLTQVLCQPRVLVEVHRQCAKQRRQIMNHKVITKMLLTALSLLGSVASASTRYVDGVNGSDMNNCLSSESACKTIGHAVSLASSGDSIMVAAATYSENLTIGTSLTLIGS